MGTTESIAGLHLMVDVQPHPPVRGGLPVYLVSAGDEVWATTSLPDELEDAEVEEVLGYLPPTGAAGD